MEFQATSKYLRISPRKVRLVADAIRKETPANALVKLSLIPKRSAEPMIKVLLSAIANAGMKNVGVDTLRFKKIEVMEGPMLKRWRAVARGSAHSYKKRMSHIRVVLEETSQTEQNSIVGGGKQ